MTILKLGAHMSIAGGVSQALDRAASIQTTALQVFTKNNRQWVGPPIDQADVARWQEQAAALGVERGSVVSHASYLINLATPQDLLWEKSMDAHADELRRAHAYGIPFVVLHPGAHVGSGADAGIDRVAAALNQIHAQTPECADTMTLLELMAGQGTTLGRSFGELRRIMVQVAEPDRVAICVDTCHAFAAGYELRTAEGYAATVAELEAEVGLDAVKCWHFNDSKGGLGSHKDRHTHIGQGEIGLEAFQMIMADPRWAGIPMLLETPKEADMADDVMNLKTLAGLVTDPARLPAGYQRSD